MKQQLNNQIILSNLQKWKEETTVRYALNLLAEKSLDCTLYGMFIVKHKGEVVWQGTQPYTAMVEYNKICISGEYEEREFTIGEELTFEVYGNTIVGTFVSIKGVVINIKVISDSNSVTKKDEISSIHKGFLTN